MWRAVDCASKLPVKQRTMQDTFSSRISHSQSFPGVGKTDTLGMLSVDSWFSPPASDFCQRTTVYKGWQNYKRLRVGGEDGSSSSPKKLQL